MLTTGEILFRTVQGDPFTIFADLLRSCISDEYDGRKSFLRDGAALFIMGIASSVLTTYFLAELRILI